MTRVFVPDGPEGLRRSGYAGYIFDWDGTLADSTQANFASMRDALAEHGVPLGWDWFNAHTGVSSVELATLASDLAGVVLDPVEVARVRDANYLRVLHEVTHVDVVVEVLRELFADGRPVAIATGGPADSVLPTVQALGLHDQFSVMVTREDASYGKPAPDIFLIAAERLGVDPDTCLVYEDSDQGLDAARRAGMDAVDVRGVQGRI